MMCALALANTSSNMIMRAVEPHACFVHDFNNSLGCRVHTLACKTRRFLNASLWNPEREEAAVVETQEEREEEDKTCEVDEEHLEVLAWS